MILIQENRTFDNLFATFPGADGTRTGKTHNGKILLRAADLESEISPDNGYNCCWVRDWNRGKMNHFDLVPIGRVPGTYVYQYVHPDQIAPYWDLAKQYVLSDHMFQTQGSGSFTAHQDLIRGDTAINETYNLIDFPTGGADQPWGCDANPGTKTSLITADNKYSGNVGPFPCLTYATLRDLLDPRDISWRYYAPAVGGSFGGNLWNAFDAIKAVRYGPEWTTNEANPETRVFTDISRDTLPSVAWVIPDYPELRSSRRQLRYRSVMGRTSRQRDRPKPRLEDDGNRDRVGRLGRMVRSRPAAGSASLRRSRLPRAGDRRFAVFKSRLRLSQ